MNRNKITEILKNYRMYKFAVRNFETTGWVAIAGTQWSDMPRSGSFGSRAPVKFSVDSMQDVVDYNAYKQAIDIIDAAIEHLTDEEQSVIRLKWMDGMTLADIATRKAYSRDTIRRTHRKALSKLSVCLRFMEAPEIEEAPVA